MFLLDLPYPIIEGPGEGRTNFADGAIDLLHIGGCSSADSFKEWIEKWPRKMSQQGVIRLNNINTHDNGIEV